MIRSLLLAALAAAPVSAQTITTVWEATIPGVTTVAVSPDRSTVAIGEAVFTTDVYRASRTAIGLRDAATGAVTGGFGGGQNGVSGIPEPYVLGFGADGTSIFSGTDFVYCGGGQNGDCPGSRSINRFTLVGQSTFFTRDLSRLDGIATSGPYLAYQRKFGPYGSEFAVFDTRQDTVSLVFREAEQLGTSGISSSTVGLLAFSPDGTRLATTGSNDGRGIIALRTVGTWTVDQAFGSTGDGQRPLEPAISPDNSTVALATYPIADGIPSGLYIFHADGAPQVFAPWAADSPYEIRYGARLAFTSDGAHIVGVEFGYAGDGTARWVSVFRASDGVRVATRRIGGSTTDPNGWGGPLVIEPVSGSPGSSRFAIAALDYAAVVEVRTGTGEVAGEGLPETGGLTAVVSPNPAASATTLRIRVSEAQPVRAELFDALGRRVAVLFDGEVSAGSERAVAIDSGAYPAGVYVVRVTGETARTSQRVVIGTR